MLAVVVVTLAIASCVQCHLFGRGPFPRAENATYSNDTRFTEWRECAASYASYDAYTSLVNANDGYSTPLSSSTYYTPDVVYLTFGTGDVFTSIDGIPLASGTFTPTKVSESTILVKYVDVFYTTTPGPKPVPSPTCSSLSPSDCSALYVSYMSSLGLPTGASVPDIVPTPSNSPACPDYFYKPRSGCTTPTSIDTNCYLDADRVDVFYFPPEETPSPTTTSPATAKTVIHSYAPGVTFTSPSVYLLFHSVYELTKILVTTCSSCDSNGCIYHDSGFGNTPNTVEVEVGSGVSSVLLSFPPEAVSTALINFPEPEKAANAIALHLLEYSDYELGLEQYYRPDTQFYGNITYRPLDFRSLTRPHPTDYYLVPFGARGCEYSVKGSPECSTMFLDEYQPIISVPDGLQNLKPEWRTCIPERLIGVTDPPIALTQTTVVNGPTYPHRPATTPGNSPMPGKTVLAPIPATTAYQQPPETTVPVYNDPRPSKPNSGHLSSTDVASGSPSAKQSFVISSGSSVLGSTPQSETAPIRNEPLQEDPIIYISKILSVASDALHGVLSETKQLTETSPANIGSGLGGASELSSSVTLRVDETSSPLHAPPATTSHRKTASLATCKKSDWMLTVAITTILMILTI